ncbi:MAG TPA: HIRAN domain-containing protein [Anaerolineaceae bacterium]|nr:hypothetical protein [Anaerolineaceae bacterium]HUM49632.1 HIRAN domain-containing protein [Anaerolineaceae bacterium]
MISFFECLGYKSSTESDFKQFWDFFSEHFTQVDLSNLTYRSLLTKQGIEMWQSLGKGGTGESFNFHYHTSTDQRGMLLDRMEAPAKNVDGLFQLQVGAEKDLRIQSLINPKEPIETHTEGYQILFQPPNYHWYGHLSLPCRATVQLTAFPETVRLFPAGTKSMPVGMKEADLGVCYILMQDEDQQEKGEDIFPLLQFGGIIRTLTSFVNEVSGKLVYAAVIDTAGMFLDLLIPPAMVDQVPKPGMCVQVQSWLTGRIREVLPPEPLLVFLMQTYVAGTYYHDVGARAQEFAFWDELALVREPHNPYDTQAIAVQSLDGEKIGYIPREKNAHLSARMDRGEKLAAYLAHRYHREGQPEQFVIRIYSCGGQNT